MKAIREEILLLAQDYWEFNQETVPWLEARDFGLEV
jgi:hypothetical protein